MTDALESSNPGAELGRAGPSSPADPKHRRTLWMGGLEHHVSEAYILAAFHAAGSHVPIKVQSEPC